MKTKTDKILAAMNVVTWIVFIGLMIKAGGILVTYGVSIWKPEGAKSLYEGTEFIQPAAIQFLALYIYGFIYDCAANL